MVYIYKRFSPNEPSPPPNSNANTQRPPSRASFQTSPANQGQKKSGRQQFQQPPPGYTMSFAAHPQIHAPPLYRPVSCAPPQFGAVNCESSLLPEDNAFGQHTFGGCPSRQYQPSVGYMSSQYCPPTNFQEGPHAMQQMQPPMEYIPPQVMYGAPAQYPPPPMHNQEANMPPFNGTVPPPGFEPNMVYNGQNMNYQYDSRCTPSPSFPGCSYNTQIPPDSPHFPTIPMQPFPLFIPSQKFPNQRRPKAIAIIDPATGEDKLNEIYGIPRSEEYDAKESDEVDDKFIDAQ